MRAIQCYLQTHPNTNPKRSDAKIPPPHTRRDACPSIGAPSSAHCALPCLAAKLSRTQLTRFKQKNATCQRLRGGAPA